MDHDELLAVIALEFGLPVLEADEFGLCGMAVNGHPAFLKQMNQDGVPCVLLSAAIGDIDLCDDATIAGLLTENLFAEGLQTGALEDGTVVVNKVLALQALSRSQALDSIRRFARHAEHWREQLAWEGVPNEPE